MPERSTQARLLFDFCYSLYLDPVYRHICFPQDIASEASLTREQFADAWASLSGPAVKTGSERVEAALSRVLLTVRKLKPVERNVLILRLGSDLPYAQIAEHVARSAEACQVIHYRALSEFCDRLNSDKNPRELTHV